MSETDDKIRCDACPVMCFIRPGMSGACDRYANQGGQLVRVDPHVLLDRTLSAGGKLVPFADADRVWSGEIIASPGPFVTAVGAGTTYPDYKPAPFIVSSKVDGVDMVTVVTEGIYSYCGVKLKIDTDRHLGAECATVRAQGEPVGHVTTGEYGSQMLSLGGVNHLTHGGKKEGRVTCETLLDLCNGKAVELTVDGGASVVVAAGKAPEIDGKLEERMRVGCGSATIGMFARQWRDKVDEVVVVDDHITGVLSEHQAGKLLGARETGIKMKGRRSTPGRYFHVAEPGTGWGGTNVRDPLEIVAGFNPKIAWSGMTMLMVSTTGEQHAFYRLDESLRPDRGRAARELARVRRTHPRELRAGALDRAVHGGRRRLAARRSDGKPGAADAIGAPGLDDRDGGRRPGVRLARRRHHVHGRRDAAAAEFLRLRADAGARRADRVHAPARRLRGVGRPCR